MVFEASVGASMWHWPSKIGARLDHQARTVNLTGDNGIRLNLHAAAGVDHAVEAAGDDHEVAVDVPFHQGVFPKHQACRRR